MFPTFTLFGREISMYFVMAMVGLFAAGIVACYLARRRKLDDNEIIIVLLFSSIGILLGGHLLYGITHISRWHLLFSAPDFGTFISRFSSIFGGAVFYGGLIGAIVTAVITIRVRKLPLAIYADILSTIIPLFHSFARVGCFLGGCCYGIESPFGFTVHGNTLVPELNDVSRFPVQLLEAFGNLLLFFLLLYLYKRSLSEPKRQGKILFFYLIAYAVMRFFDEFLRGDEIRGFLFGLSTSQVISIVLFLFAVVSLIVIEMRRKTPHTD